MTKISLPTKDTKTIVKENNKQIIETGESESEYVRASECTKIMDQAAEIVINLKEELHNKEKSLLAFDKLIRELSDKNKISNNQVKMLNQELDYYKNKNNVKINTKISEHKLLRLFDKDNKKIKNLTVDDVDETIAELRKFYSC